MIKLLITSTLYGYTFYEILRHFSELTDGRSHINRCYDLMDIMFLTVSAVLSGAEGWSDIEKFGLAKLSWLRKFRDFDEGIPVDDTIARTIRRLKPDEFNKSFISWVNELLIAQGDELIAIDGKSLRHSFDGERHSALHSITVWVKSQGLVFCQQKSEGKKNEIISAQKLIESLELTDTTVTLDAMHCQKRTAQMIRKKGGDYVLCVKGNQKGLQEEISDWFDGFGGNYPELSSIFEESEKGHGRLETRRYTQLPVTPQLELATKWHDCQSIVKVERTRELKGKNPTTETVHYITSKAPDAQFIASAIRSHWEVENKAHWVLDMTFREDDSRIRKDDGAENVAIIRRLCMNLVRLHPKKGSVRGKLKQAGWDDEFRTEILFQA